MNDTVISAKLLASGSSSLDPAFASLLSELDPLVATVSKAVSDSEDLLQRTKVSWWYLYALRLNEYRRQTKHSLLLIVPIQLFKTVSESAPSIFPGILDFLQVLNDLSAKYEAFVELRAHLEEGTKVIYTFRIKASITLCSFTSISRPFSPSISPSAATLSWPETSRRRIFLRMFS